MNKILKIALLPSALAVAGPTGIRAQTGVGSSTADNSYLGTASTDSTFEYAESLYIGPNAVWEISGVHTIYSKNVWIAPTAQIAGTGKLIFANPDDNPFYPDMTGSTIIDGNDGNFIDVNIVNANPANIVMADIADPGYGTTNPPDGLAAAFKVGKDFKFEVAGGDVLLGDYDMITDATATLSGYQPDRFIVTNGSGHLVHNNYIGAFIFPVGITELDYTPANINNTTASDMHVLVQDYASSNSVENGDDGIQRTWNIYSSSAAASAVVDLQHNSSTNQASFNNDSHFVTRYSSLNPNTTGDNATGSTGPWQSNALVAGDTGTLSSTGSVAGSIETSHSYSNFATTASDEVAYYSKSSNQTTPLPLHLLSFTAIAHLCEVTLNWVTENEESFDHFEVQYSNDAVSYSTLGSVMSKGSNLQNNYNYQAPQPTGTGYYRLSMVEIDGGHTYSNTVAVRTKCAGNLTWTLYPNPVEAGNNLYLQINNGDSNAQELRLMALNILGQRLTDQLITVQPGINRISIPLTRGWSSGNYTIDLYTVQGTEVGHQQRLVLK